MNDYHIFTRTFYRENSKWPNGLEPYMSRKTTVCYVDTYEEARDYCQRENTQPRTVKQVRLSWKHEFERA